MKIKKNAGWQKMKYWQNPLLKVETNESWLADNKIQINIEFAISKSKGICKNKFFSHQPRKSLRLKTPGSCFPN